MKKICFRVIAGLILACVLFILPSCGTKDARLGRYSAVSILQDRTRFAASRFYENGASIDLRAGGTGVLTQGDSTTSFTWETQGHDLAVHFGDIINTGHIYDGLITIDRLLGTSLSVSFMKDGYTMSPLNRVEVKDGNLDGCSVEFVGAEYFEEFGGYYYDKDTLEIVGKQEVDENLGGMRIYYEITNTSDQTITPVIAIRPTASQDGEELAMGSAEENPVYKSYNLLNLRPGAKVRAAYNVAYKKDGGKVTAEIYGGGNDSELCILKDYDPAALPGAPSGDWKPEKVADPNWTQGLETKGSFGSMDVELLDVEQFSDEEGDLVRVYVQITNNSEEAHPAYDEVLLAIYQDDVELKRSKNTERCQEDEWLDGREIPAGASVKAGYVCRLFSDSPLEIEAYTYNSEMRLGKKVTLQ